MSRLGIDSDSVFGISWLDAAGEWLLPIAAVAEVVPFTPEATSSGDDWLIGWTQWRAQILPAVTLEPFGTELPPRAYLLICPAMDADSQAQAFGIYSITLPQLALFQARELEVDPSAQRHRFALRMLRWRDRAAAIPDLAALEQAINDAISV